MKLKLLTIIVILTLSGCASAQKPQPSNIKAAEPMVDAFRNKSEHDFRWLKSKLGTSEFVFPKDWFARIEVKKGHYALFITKEEIEDGKQFQTGFSLNFNPHIKQKTGSTPSEYAKAFVYALANKEGKEVLQEPYMRFYSNMKMFAVSVKDEKIVMFQLLAANDKTGSLFTMWFEAPVDEWKDAWKIGKVIVSNLRLDEGL